MERANSSRDWRPPPALLLTVLILTVILTAIAAGSTTLPGDVELLNALHEADSPILESIDMLGYSIGSLQGITVVAVALAAAMAITGRIAEGLLLVSSAIARNLNPVIKRFLASPRPSSDVVQVTENATNYGFPSGHVMGTTLVYGCIFYVAHVTIRNRPARVLIQMVCALAIAVTTFSRLYSGAHWPTDVLGGYLWGTLMLLILIGIYNTVLDRRQQRARSCDAIAADLDRTDQT